MRLELTGKGIDVTAGLRQLVNRRLERVERLLGRAAVSAQCVLSKQKYLSRVDLTVHAAGEHFFKGVGEGRNWPAAMTTAVEKVMQQAHTLKDKWKDRRHADTKPTPKGKRATVPTSGPAGAGTSRAGGDRVPAERPASPASAVAANMAADPARPRIRKTRYPVKPMTVDEAASLLLDNDEEFLVFRDARTESVTVLFRRSDGILGLIETEQ